MTVVAAPYQRVSALIERWTPFAVGVISALATYRWGYLFFSAAELNGWDYGVIYSSVFDVTSIFTAFLFAFYSFILTQEIGFVARMRKTISYKMTIRFTLSALYLGGILIVYSIPMMVISPSPPQGTSLAQLLVAIWAGLTFWSMLSFARAAWLFSVFAVRGRQ